jgi:hypothetical protein
VPSPDTDRRFFSLFYSTLGTEFSFG